MRRETQLLKNTAIITVGKICTQMISFFLLPLYTTILTTEEFGIVDLLNVLVSLAIPIITLQIEQAVFRNLIDSRNDSNKIKNIISSCFFIIIVQILCLTVFFCVFSRFIHNDYKYYLLCNIIVAICSTITLQIARGLGDNKTYAVGSFLIASISVILNVLFIVYLKMGAKGILIANCISHLLSSFYITFKIKLYKFINIKFFKKDMLKSLYKYSLPLIPNAISWWIFNSSDRIIITVVLGIAFNGIMSAAYKFSNLYITLYNIFYMAWTETAALHIDDNDSEKFFSNIINTALKIFTSIAFGIIGVMPFVFPLMVNEKFALAYYQIPILMIASIFNVMVGLLSVIYVSKKETNAIAKTSIMAAIINIIVNVVLIRNLGLFAASISTLIAYLAMAVYRIKDIRKYIKINYDKYFVLESIIMGIIIIISYYINNVHLNVLTLLIILLYSVIINKKIFVSIINVIKYRIIKNR